MDQLFAAFGVDWKHLLVQAVNFGVLLAVLSYLLYKPLMRIIDERREFVASGVRSAQEADRVLEDSKKRGGDMVGEAAREAEHLVATARSRADEKSAEIVKAAEAKALALINDAAARAEESKRQALLESEKEITKVAVLAAEKILRERA
jgi:F-type H+-transporting ATPase subunit b